MACDLDYSFGTFGVSANNNTVRALHHSKCGDKILRYVSFTQLFILMERAILILHAVLTCMIY